MVINGFEYIPREKRKNILLLSDDLRLSSGVGTVSRIFVTGTAHRYNWFQLGAAINHPDLGKRIDVSDDVNKAIGINDSKVIIQPNNGYGDPDIIRHLLDEFNFDAILHFTDPRQWIWLYNMEHELRQRIPILFYHVWDNTPPPKYNKPYYLSCDWIGCISKQTKSIVNAVCCDEKLEDWKVTYIPHGIESNVYFPINEIETGAIREIEPGKLMSDFDLMNEYRKKIFGNKDIDFVVFFNNRNIKRKNPGDVILTFKMFCDSLPKEKAEKTALLLHTQAIDVNGTDLFAVINAIAPDCNIIIHQDKIDSSILNYFYNIADVTINISSAEGFGLSTAESIMAGTPIIATVTGGLQDQMGFKDENGKYIEFTNKWHTNADGKYKNSHGPWVYPIFPSARSLVGSPPTPYIFDDRVSLDDVVDGLKYWYNMSREKRKKLGAMGRKFMLNVDIGMSADEMNRRFIYNIDNVLNNWKPIERYKLIKI